MAVPKDSQTKKTYASTRKKEVQLSFVIQSDEINAWPTMISIISLENFHKVPYFSF